LGESLLAQQKYTAAVEAFDRCLELYPGHTPAIDGRMRSLLPLCVHGGYDIDEVVAWLTGELAANPPSSQILCLRATAYLARSDAGDRERAVEDLERAAGLSEFSTRPYETAGVMFVEQAEAESDRAERVRLARLADSCFELALRRANYSYKPALRNWRSYALQYQGEYGEAIRQAELGRRQSPNYPNNHLAVCCANLAAGSLDEAEKAARRWLDSPYAAASHPTRIWIRAFLCLAMSCRDASPADVRTEMLALISDRAAYPGFRVGWQWEPAQRRIQAELVGTDRQTLYSDVISLLGPSPRFQEIRARYQATRPLPGIALRTAASKPPDPEAV